MPTRKQKRRQQKLRRHEWEDVYVDEEGRELAPEEVEELGIEAPARRPARKDGAKRPERVRNPVKPPSWRRVFKRTAFLAPVGYLLISVLPGTSELSVAGRLVATGQLVLLFIPFSYVMDTLTYRLWKRRTEGAQP